MENTNVNRFHAATDEELLKLTAPKLGKQGWQVLVIGGAKIRDAQSGKWGINVTASPATSMESDTKIKKNIRVYDTLWAWFKDPSNKKRKPADSFGLFEQFVRAFGVTMPSDGTELPGRARRDAATGKLVGPDGAAISTQEANVLTLAYNKWLDQLYKELVSLVEAGENPLKNYMAYGKIVHNKGQTGDQVYANIEKLSATLPDDAVLVDPFAKDDGDDSDDDSEDDN